MDDRQFTFHGIWVMKESVVLPFSSFLCFFRFRMFAAVYLVSVYCENTSTYTCLALCVDILFPSLSLCIPLRFSLLWFVLYSPSSLIYHSLVCTTQTGSIFYDYTNPSTRPIFREEKAWLMWYNSSLSLQNFSATLPFHETLEMS